MTVPVPRNTISCKTSLPDTAKGQAAEYIEGEKVVAWAIKKFQGQSEQQIRIRLTLQTPCPNARAEIGPVSMDFEIPMWNPSTMNIRFLRIIERSEQYKPQR